MKEIVTFLLFALFANRLDGQTCSPVDQFFGNSGLATGYATSLIGDISSTHLFTQPDGKIIQVGTIHNSTYHGRFVALRYNSDGTPDLSFGTNGQSFFGPHIGSGAIGDVTIQQDGKILLVGTRNYQHLADFVLLRLKTNGKLDSTFGTFGQVIYSTSEGSEMAKSVVLQPDGKIIVAGVSNGTATICGNPDYPFPMVVLVRFNVNGSIDASFGQNGKVLFGTENYQDMAFGVTLQTDGKIVTAVNTYYDCTCEFDYYGGGGLICKKNLLMFVRFKANGSIDSSFGHHGIGIDLEFSNYASKMVLQSDGKILVAAEKLNELIIKRYNNDGSIDRNFGTAGQTLSVIGEAGQGVSLSSMLTQADGKLVVGGTLLDNAETRVLVIRYNYDGNLDNEFNGNGIATFRVGKMDGYQTGGGLTIQNSNIITGVSTYNDQFQDLGITRLKVLPIPAPPAPTVTIVNNCGNSILTAGSFTGSLIWSNGQTTSSITALTPGTYAVTQTIAGCTSAPGSGIAAPKTKPVLLSDLSATATSGSTFSYTATSTISGTTFAWTRAVVAGISNGASNGTGNVSEILINTTSSPVAVTYAYNLTASGCNNMQHVVVTVYPASSTNCTIDKTSLTSNFNTTAIPAGRYIWFNSTFDPGALGTGTDPVTIYFSNGVISFTANNIQYNLNVPNARIRLDGSATSASTQFINNVWETVVPGNYSSDIFMSALSYPVPVNFPGNYMNVKWTANINIDKPGISLGWRWAAAVYTSYSDHGGINVKPINGSTQNLYPNSDRAGTPENFKSFVAAGAKGTGGVNYTGSYSSVMTVTCTGGQIPAAPKVTVLNNCGNAVLTATSFTGSLLWSNGATTPSITVTTPGTYTVTQTVNGVTSAAGSGKAAPKKIPQLLSGLVDSVYSNTLFAYNAESDVPGTSFAWSRSAVSGITNPEANGTGNISETLINTAGSPVDVAYVYTLSANGCTSTREVIVTINPFFCTINNTSVTSNFNASPVPAGRYIWFNSTFDLGPLPAGTGPVTILISGGVISFTANNVQYNLKVPNARIAIDSRANQVSTRFINNTWETAVPSFPNSDIFMAGLAYLVPVNFPGNYMNVKWTANIGIDKPGISVGWRWSAAVYTTFADHPGISVQPMNGGLYYPYINSDRAGTPENFKEFVVAGAKGTGGTNYTGSFSTSNTSTCSWITGQRSLPQPIVMNEPILSSEKFVNQNLEVNVLPNPGSAFFNLVIKGNNDNAVTVTVVDIFGKVVEKYEKINSKSVLQIGRGLRGGCYFVEVIQNDQRKLLKIVKVN